MKIFKQKTDSNKVMRYFSERKEKLSMSGYSVTFDWYIILTISAALFIVLMIYSWNLYFSIKNEIANMEDVNSSSISLNERELRVVIDNLAESRVIRSAPLVEATSTEENVEIIDEGQSD